MSRWIGSWLAGPRAAVAPAGDPDGPAADGAQRWRGERLGLPQTGPGSVASTGRRVVAFLVDIVVAGLVAAAFTAPDLPKNWSLAAWFLITVGTVSFFGLTPGMFLAGIRVARLDGAPMVGPIRAIPRTIMVGLVIPAVVWNADGRGLHDRATGTVVVHAPRW